MEGNEVQRRLAAILSADVVGYSRLMAIDEAGTLGRLKALRHAVINPLIAQHNGRIFKLMGDGALLEYSSVVDAVRSAVEVQEAMVESNAGIPDGVQIRYRMGINLGDIIDDGEDIHGEGVNVADRLEGLADPGGICISGMVYESIRNRIEADFEDMGEQEVKNVSAPVRAYRIRIAGVAEAALDDAISSRPSIAVLPLDNLFGEEAQEYFSDGVTEDIISALIRAMSCW